VQLSVPALNKSIERLAQKLSDEIVQRLIAEVGHYAHGRDVALIAGKHANAVLVEWFMGGIDEI
jgi:hypothetical protein